MLFGLFCTCVVVAAIAWLGIGVQLLKQRVQTMSTSLDNLKSAVAAQTTLDQSAVTLIQGIATQLTQPDADVQALADQLNAAAQPLAAAIAANTPAASATATTPPAPAAAAAAPAASTAS